MQKLGPINEMDAMKMSGAIFSKLVRCRRGHRFMARYDSKEQEGVSSLDQSPHLQFGCAPNHLQSRLLF